MTSRASEKRIGGKAVHRRQLQHRRRLRKADESSKPATSAEEDEPKERNAKSDENASIASFARSLIPSVKMSTVTFAPVSWQ